VRRIIFVYIQAPCQCFKFISFLFAFMSMFQIHIVFVCIHNYICLLCDVVMFLRTRLVRCNGYYTVIGINITRNKRNCNVITITIHVFGDNT
jgi:hypothetical protein